MTTIPYASAHWVDVRHDLSELRGNWGWFVALGVLMIVLGFAAMSALFIASVATAIAIGAMLLVGGAIEAVGAASARRWSGFFLHLLSGVLSIVVGVLFLRAPVGALFALTLLLACLLMVGGLFRITAGLTYRFHAWQWSMVGGVIDVVLGVLIWFQWPRSAFWVIGLFLGISLIFHGVDWIGLGSALRALQRRGAAPAQTATPPPATA